MKRWIERRILVAGLLLACIGPCPLQRLVAQEGEGLVMVASKNSSAGQLTLPVAKKILLGETSTWPNGQKVLVILKPAGSPDRIAVLKKVCGMTETLYTRYELQASFTGETAATVNVAASDAAVKATLRSNPSAIGFLHKNAVDDSIKVLLTLD